MNSSPLFNQIMSITCALLIHHGVAFAEPLYTWQLPMEVNDSNTTVHFEVDSTWHLVEGKTSQLSGNMKLGDEGDPLSVRSEIHLPVSKFDTDNSSRDESMREVMAMEQFPEVIFKTMALKGSCTPDVVAQGPCKGLLDGTLSIRGVERKAAVPYSIVRAEDSFLVQGEFPFEWAAFGVEDPSIFIARLHKTVKVSFKIRIPARIMQSE